MTKKYIYRFMFVVCALLCVLLAGCAQIAGSTADNRTENEASAADVSASDAAADEQQSDYAGKTTLTYIGHASVKIVAKDGSVLYIDPHYYAGDYSDAADCVCVTHCHDDHKPHEDVVLKPDGTLILYNEALHDGIYETYDCGSFKVEAVPAGGNVNHNINSCVGYIVTVDGVTVYHAGDTSMIEQMNDLAERELDYAMFPIDGKANMNAKAATEVAAIVGAKHNIPIHEMDDYGKPKKSEKFTPEGKLVLEYGETIVISE